MRLSPRVPATTKGPRHDQRRAPRRGAGRRPLAGTRRLHRVDPIAHTRSERGQSLCEWISITLSGRSAAGRYAEAVTTAAQHQLFIVLFFIVLSHLVVSQRIHHFRSVVAS